MLRIGSSQKSFLILRNPESLYTEIEEQFSLRKAASFTDRKCESRDRPNLLNPKRNMNLSIFLKQFKLPGIKNLYLNNKFFLIFTIANEIIKLLKNRDAKSFSVDRTKNLLSILQLDSEELEFEILSIKNHVRDFGSINLSMAEEFIFLLSGKYQKFYELTADDFFLVIKNDILKNLTIIVCLLKFSWQN